MKPDEKDYYRARAVAERGLAKTTSDPRVARVHEELASHYEKLVSPPSEPVSVWRSFLAALSKQSR